MSFIAVYVNGEVTEIEHGYESIVAVIGRPIDFVFVHPDLGFFIDDEGLLNRSKLNVVASIVAGRALYGNCVATKGYPDEVGDSLPPAESAVAMLKHIGHLWRHVTDDAQRLGQDPYVASSPDNVPPPIITQLPSDWFNDPQAREE